MDQVDQANSLLESELTDNIQRTLQYRRKPQANIKPMGYCHTCDAEVEAEKLFCNGRCASQFPG